MTYKIDRTPGIDDRILELGAKARDRRIYIAYAPLKQLIRNAFAE